MSVMWRHLHGTGRSVAQANYASVVLGDQPVGYWRMNAASGTTESDVSGNGRNGTISGGVTLNQGGAISDGDAAELFNGTTGSIDLGNVSAFDFTAAFSIEGWFKTTNVSAAKFIASKSDNATDAGWELFKQTDGTIRFLRGNNVGGLLFDISTTAAFADGSWHHVVATWTGTTVTNGVQLFIDGALVTHGTAAAGTAGTTAQSALIGWIGNAGNGPRWDGTLDELAFYNVALSAAQVAAHYATARL